MSEIIYRQIKEEDYEDIKVIINESFGLYKYIDDPKILKTVLKVYLEGCLAEKTFSSIAEKDGKVIGVIFGNSKKDYSILKHLKPILRTVGYTILMEIQSIGAGESVKAYKRMNKIYAELLANSGKKFDGILTLFAVTEASRGLGVGKKLVANFQDYLETTNTNEVYLYTDSTCNVGFYDSQGFKRIGSKNVDIEKEDKQVNMDVYLYEYVME